MKPLFIIAFLFSFALCFVNVAVGIIVSLGLALLHDDVEVIGMIGRRTK